MTATFSAAAQELRVAGDDQDNTVVVSRDAGGTILVNNGAVPIQGGTPTVANTTHLDIVGAGGNDRLSLDETNGALPGAAIFGGAGNDTISSGSGIDFIDGGPGSDTASLGAGNDTFQWNPGDGSDLVEGQGLRDTLVFNGADVAETIDISATGNRVRFTRDVGNITMDLNGIEAINFNAFGGADTVTVNDQSATAVLDVNLDLNSSAGAGDGQADSVVINGTGADDFVQIASFDRGSRISVASTLFPVISITGAEEANDRLTVNALGGNDGVDAGSLAASAIGLALNGGAGNDELLAGGGNDLVNGGPGSDMIFLEAGDDTFVWNNGDGSDTLEGMAGNDTMQFNGSDVNEAITLSPNGARLRLVRDAGNVTMDVNDVERVDVNPLSGADTIDVKDLNGTDVNEIDLNLSGAPGTNTDDAQVDSVIVNGSNGPEVIPVQGSDGGILVNGDFLSTPGLPFFMVIKAVGAIDSLRINGNGGNDRIEADLDTPVMLRADGGAQQDTINVMGTASNGVVSVLPSSGDDTVTVNTDGVGVANVSFDATQRVGTLSIGSRGIATLTASGAKALTVTSLSITGAGRLDLTDNAMIVDHAGVTPISSIRALLASGFNGGSWDGFGIISSSAARLPNTGIGFAEATDLFTSFPATFKGQTIDNTSVLLRHTLKGDADLNGAVNLLDFNRFAANFGQTNRRWSQGDFDYNGTVDLVDFNRLAANFGISAAPEAVVAKG